MPDLIRQGHPKGLYLLFFVEMWERFSYYGMRALLILYMVQELMFSTEKAGNVYGIYTGLVYLTPLLGGYIADRFLGQRKCVTIGAILMSCGLFLLAYGGAKVFLLSFFIMIMANGFFKSNISSILGILYGDDNEKKDFLSAMGVNNSGLDKLIYATYDLLGLATFFTSGKDEVRAWTFKKGMKAPQCAGIIHTDFEKGFIKAEVTSFSDLKELGSEAKVKEAGKLRLEGKDYLMQDGDICYFRFNV